MFETEHSDEYKIAMYDHGLKFIMEENLKYEVSLYRLSYYLLKLHEPMEYGQCSHCMEAAGGIPESVEYPCPTIRLLEEMVPPTQLSMAREQMVRVADADQRAKQTKRGCPQ